MPTNRKTVTSIELRTWLATLPKVGSSPPQKFSAKTSARNAGDGDDDEERDRHDLGEGRDGVERRRLLDAAQDQDMHAPQQDRRRDDGDGRRAVAEHREEQARASP